MRRTALVLVCLWASVGGVAGPVVPCEVKAADPPKVAVQPAPPEPATIDQLMKQLTDLRAQKAEIEKREKATLAELKERLQLLRDLLKDLDLDPVPGPTPAPKPPPPGPTAPPIAGEGNRVLIVYETGDRLPAKQAAILTSGILRDYLDAECAKDSANPTGAYRIWDQNVDLSHPSVSPSWKAAMARPRASLPWIVISNGKSGYEGPLPESVEATLELLKKHFRGR